MRLFIKFAMLHDLAVFVGELADIVTVNVLTLLPRRMLRPCIDLAVAPEELPLLIPFEV